MSASLSSDTCPPSPKRMKVENSKDTEDKIISEKPPQEMQDKTSTKNSCESNGNGATSSKKFDEKRLDHDYFDSYADVEVHRTMIEDQARTDAYRNAIMQEPSLIKDKVVCDVGCGSGILSMFCAQAGAKKVYAIDASSIAKQAKLAIKSNGFENIITVLEGRAEDVVLPEKVDVVVSEWMGHMLLYETMLPSVLHVRDKWLKPGGLMFPERATMQAAMAETSWITKYEEATYDFWISLHPMYGLEMSALADHAVDRYKELAHLWIVPQSDVISSPAQICDLDLNTVTSEQLEVIKCEFSLSSMGSRRLNCLVVWFDVTFPGGGVLSTSPHAEETHWQHTVLPLRDVKVAQDTQLKAAMRVAQHKKRSLDVRLQYSVDGGEEIIRQYRLDEKLSDDDD